MDLRTNALVAAAGRIAFGAGFLAAPALTGRVWVGDKAGTPAGQLFLRTTGARDIGIGLGALAALRAGDSARLWFVASLIADATDAVATVLVREELSPSELWGTVAVAGGSAVLDVILISQLDWVDKRRFTTNLAKYTVNPLVRGLARLGISPGAAVLETTGWKSGRPRQTPVTNGLQGDTFWIVTEHGHRAAYVKNIKADPQVRVKVGRTWRSGTAHVMPDDDAEARRRSLGTSVLRRMNANTISVMATEKLTVRVDLDPL